MLFQPLGIRTPPAAREAVPLPDFLPGAFVITMVASCWSPNFLAIFVD
jgi:hypothetical protein